MIRSLALVVFGLTIVGCAVGIEDPQPPPTPEPEQGQPPAQTFSTQLGEIPFHSAERGAIDDAALNLPPKQKPPVPGLNSVPKAEYAGADDANGAN